MHKDRLRYANPMLFGFFGLWFCVACGSPPAVEEAIEPGPLVDEAETACAEGIAMEDGRCASVAQLGVGQYQGCALLNSGAVMCWGPQPGGWSQAPTVVAGLKEIVQLAINDGGRCALDSQGAVYCFDEGVKKVEGIKDASKIAVGGGRGCALDSKGSLSCWALQPEDGHERGALSVDQELVPSWDEPMDFVDLAFSNAPHFNQVSACALTQAGQVWCWGSNFSGQLGDGNLTSSEAPVQVKELDDAVAIAGGRYHFCALRIAGELVCWGGRPHNPRKKPGAGAIAATSDQVLMAVPTPTKVVEIFGGERVCARLEDGSAQCWLGMSPEHSPLEPFDLSYQSLHMGTWLGCALSQDGQVYCWRQNDDPEHFFEPTLVPGLPPIVALTADYSATCADDRQGQRWCWGGPTSIQSPDARVSYHFAPVLQEDFKDLHLGVGCEQIEGALNCWGDVPVGDQWELGQVEPTSIEPLLDRQYGDLLELAVQGNAYCSRNASGAIHCWGPGWQNKQNAEAEDGVAILGVANPQALVLGRHQGCALDGVGEVYCWPTASSDAGSIQAQKVGLSEVKALDAEGAYACAIKKDGSLWCWGEGDDGQMGEGTSRHCPKPVQVAHVEGAVALALATWHGCVLLDDASVKCWGNGAMGFLGIGKAPILERFAVEGLASQRCGDGALYHGEGCDDGNLDDGDGCSAECALEASFVCEGHPSRCAREGSGDGCGVAIELSAGQVLSGTLADLHNWMDVTNTKLSVVSGGNEAIFKLEVPAESEVKIEVESGADLVLYALEAQGECPRWTPNIVAGNDASQQGLEQLKLMNTKGKARVFWVVVDSYVPSTEDFMLQVGGFQPVGAAREL